MKPSDAIEAIHAVHETETDTDKHERLVVEAALRAIDDASAQPALYAALARAQGKFPPIPRNRTVKVQTKSGGSYTFDYAPLETVLDFTRAAMTEEELALTQLIRDEDGKTYLVTMLLHSAGGSLTSRIELSSAQTRTPQEFGSLLTYLRRYCVQSILGVATEEDDDANTAQGNTVAAKQERPRSATQQTTGEVAAPSHVAEPRGAAAQEAPSPVGSNPHGDEAWWDRHSLADLNKRITEMTADQARAGLILEGNRQMRGKGQPRKTVLSALSDQIRSFDEPDGGVAVEPDLGGGPKGDAGEASVSQATTEPTGSDSEPASPPKELLLVKAALAWIADQPESVDNANAWTQTGILLGISQLPPENEHLGTYASLEEVPSETLQWIWESAVPDPVMDAVLRLGPEQLATLAGQAK